MTLMIKIFFFAFQGFNRLVAIALLFMAEEDAFWCLVYIIESLMPPEYYSRDKQLIGAQVDQVSIFSTVFENPAKSLIQHCERSELCLHFEWTKVHKNAKNGQFWRLFENLKLAVKQCYQTGHI